jgi:transglutaminase-like putative cysteine protease
MKKLLTLLLITILLTTATLAQSEIYLQDSLDLELNIKGEFELVKENPSATLREVETQLLLFPTSDYRQDILNTNTNGIIQENKIVFKWEDKQVGTKEYNYQTTIKTNNNRKEVFRKIPFPIKQQDIQDLQQYLEPSPTIDSDNPKIIQQATKLVEGEDDLFVASFKLANWVESNVDYDLNSLTETASQKASWVLDNKQGVCDEMTSLFVAMARSVGIPARFASGISYTTSDLFDENWQPHGWAEAYFPSVGWVSFDITFGEYGYVDVTHIKLRDGFDPAEPATKFSWYANNVALNAKDLELDVNILNQGQQTTPLIDINVELLSENIDFGSYNLIKATVENKAPFYTATALRLAIPKEVEVIGRDQRTILMKPNQIKETHWIVKVKNNLNKKFWYEFPAMVYSENNITDTKSFKAQNNNQFYTKEDIEKLIVKDEEKSYSREIQINCDNINSLKINEQKELTCTLKNTGNANLKNVEFCIEDICKVENLPINQELTNSITLTHENSGWKKAIVSVKSQTLEKSQSIDYQVTDEPQFKTTITNPNNVDYNQNFNIIIDLEKTSFSIPKNLEIKLNGPQFTHTWTISELTDTNSLSLELEKIKLSKTNKFTIDYTWEDENNNNYDLQEEITITANSNNFKESVVMFFNSIINFFD